MECCHYNDIKSDNRLENLRWDYRLSNVNDKIRNNRTGKGRKRSKEFSLRMSKLHKGKIVSKKTRQKMSEAKKGTIVPDRIKEKISLATKGENNPRSKLNNLKVRIIRHLYQDIKCKNITIYDLCDYFDVGYTAIHEVLHNKSWRHI